MQHSRRIIRPARPGDTEPLRTACVEHLGIERTAESWDWWFARGPDGPVHAFVIEDGDELVGHFGHVPAGLWAGGERRRLGIGGHTFVARGHQGPGGLAALSRAAMADGHGLDVRMNFPGVRARVVYERLGLGTVAGQIPVWVRSFSAATFGVHGPVRARATSLAARAAAAALAAGPVGARVEALAQPGAEVDALAECSRAFAPCIRVRDAAYLRWRWLDMPGGSWEAIAARDRRGGLRGWAVLGEDPASARGLVPDLLAADAAALRALLLHAARVLRRRGCEAVEVTLHDPRPWARPALRRSGFLRGARQVDVMVGRVSDRVGDEVCRLDSWYLTAGDTDAANVTGARFLGARGPARDPRRSA